MILENNAYKILGLDSSASQKDILRRSKEIINRLQINDNPEYELDNKIFENDRTEETVNEALRRLQSSSKRLVEYFFWFQIADDVDKKAIDFVKNNELQSAIVMWGKDHKDDTINSFLHKKNLALLLTYILTIEDNLECLEKSLLLWKEVTDSDKYWSTFKKVYLLYNDDVLDNKKLSNFKDEVLARLSDLYTEFYEKYKNPEYLELFQNTFPVKGGKIQKVVLDPAFKKINKAVEGLEEMNVSEDGVLDEDESEKIKRLIRVIQSELNSLIDMGMYEDSQTILMRDRAAETMRSIVLDIHNNLEDVSLAKRLLEVAIKFCGTDSLKHKLTKELEQIDENIKSSSDNKVTLEIPGFFSTNNANFTNTSLEYKGKTIQYKDATCVAWHSMKESVNGIPTSQKYTFYVASDTESIDISYTAAFRGGETHNVVFGKLVGISNAIIEPVVIKKLCSRIFDNKETITIGSLHINDRGCYKNKFFGGVEEVLWPDVKYKPQLSAGQAVVYSQDKKGNSTVFTSVSMSTGNAVLIPELIMECLKIKN